MYNFLPHRYAVRYNHDPTPTIYTHTILLLPHRYAGLLEATMDHAPNVCSIPPHELLDFCVDHG